MDPDSKRISTGGTTDRLSNLPCNIIGQILGLLPMKDAARTSVLSKKWKDKWLTIPHLVFDEGSSESNIYHVLLLHKEPIVTFTIRYANIETQTALYHWFNFLSKHKIEELTIGPPIYFEPDLVMPCHLFSFHHLKHLSLQFVGVKVPLSTYNGFSNLTSIDFEDVFIEVEELQRLIQKCPKLESLSLVDNADFIDSILHISTHLKAFRFQFQGVVDFAYICSNPHLEDVSFFYSNIRMVIDGTELDYAIKFFSHLSLIKKLEVNGYFLQVFGGSELLKLPQDLNHLKDIQFREICLDSVSNLKSALCLIRSSPNLRTLVIESDSKTRYARSWIHKVEDAALQYLKDEQKLTLPLSSSLEQVKFCSINGNTHEMKFVKLLLLGSKKLGKLRIDYICCKNELSIVKELASFPRASSQAVILIGPENIGM